jgi:hypothetical protein
MDLISLIAPLSGLTANPYAQEKRNFKETLPSATLKLELCKLQTTLKLVEVYVNKQVSLESKMAIGVSIGTCGNVFPKSTPWRPSLATLFC